MKRRFMAAVVVWVVCAAAPLHAEPSQAPPKPQDESGTTEGRLEDSGVTVQTVCTNCNNADLTLGGLGNEHVPIVCDGLPVPRGLAQIYLLSVMPATAIDRVTVERGASAADAEASGVGGKIEIRRREPRPGVQLYTSADAGAYGWGGARADVTGGAGRWFGGFRGSWATSNPVEEGRNGFRSMAGFDRRTLEGSGELRVKPGHRLRVGIADYDEKQKEASGGFDGLTWMFSGRQTFQYLRQDTDLKRRQYDVHYELPLADGSRIALGALHGRREETLHEQLIGGTPLLDTYTIGDTTEQAEASWSRAWGVRWRTRAGAAWGKSDFRVVDVRFNAFTVGLPADQWFAFALKESITESGAWAEAEWNPAPGIDVTVGARWAKFVYEDNEADTLAFAPGRVVWLGYDLPQGDRILPRTAVTWKPDPSWTLRATAGSGFSIPPPTYSEVCCGRRYRSNRGLRPERSFAIGAEATWQPDPKLKVSGSASITDFDDLAVKIASLTYSYGPTYQNVNVPKARYTALGFEGRFELASWISIRSAATWTSASNRTDGDRIPVIADFGGPTLYDEHSARIPYVASRNATIAADMHPSRGATVTASAQHTGSMLIQYFDPDRPRSDALQSETQPYFIASPSFWTFAVRVERRLRRGLSVYAGVDNVTDYVDTDLGNPAINYEWGPLRGRYAYAGLSWEY